jgi:1,4-dihydroxy-6-naphthoate synthase
MKIAIAYEVMPFDFIQDAVREGRAEARLLIHEGQLTYADEGLQKVVDLGEWWADRTGGLPLPLGNNVIRRDLGMETMRRVASTARTRIASSGCT